MVTTLRHRARVLSVGLSAVLALVGTVSGCTDRSSQTGDVREQRSASSSDPAKQADASRGLLIDARTVDNQRAPFCSAPTPNTVTRTLYSPVVTAEGDVTIQSARAMGRGVQLVDAEGAVATGDPKNVGVGVSDTWPLDALSRVPADEQTRRPLNGMEVTSGQSVVPLWRISFEPDSHLRGLRIDYDAGGGAMKTLFLALDTTYSRDAKGC